MGPRTRSAASGPQLDQPVEEMSIAAPSVPIQPEQADGQAPATALLPEPAATLATPAVPVRKSIRILTRKEEPKTTPSQQTSSETNLATTQTVQTPAQTAAFALTHEAQLTHISIDQLLASPQHHTFAQSTRTTRQQLQPQHQLQLQKTEPDLQGHTYTAYRAYDLSLKDDHDDHDDLRDGHYKEETSEEEQFSKHSTRHYGQRQRQAKQSPKKQSRYKSPQKKSARGRSAKPSSTIPSADFYQVQHLATPLPQSSSPPTDTMIVERKIKLVTEQHNINKAPQVEGFPMKEWTVEVYILDEAGKEKPARCFHKVVYNLHPSFANPVQTFHEPPFKCTNEGWGEFEMTIDCYTTEKGGKQSILHDLNFANPTYENIHTIQFKNPSQALQAVLRETGPLPTDEDRKARKNLDGPGGGSIVSKKKKTYDLEKMADAIPRLSEDDLLHVIQLIHDNKNDDTYIMNNPDAGEFSIDLYTMPDNLCRLMWEFLLQSSEGHRLR